MLGVQVIEGIRQYYGRLGLRQRVEMEALAPDFGLVCHDIKSAQEERNVWSKADGTVIGLYSLLPRAGVGVRNETRPTLSAKGSGRQRGHRIDACAALAGRTR